MAKFKKYDYSQKIFLPVSLEDQLMPGTLEFTIHALVENRVGMSIFEDRYNNDETGRSAYDPKVLLKIVLLGYSRGLTSSRDLERACTENVLFIALSCGQHPDHSTIAAFVSSMQKEILLIFRDILMVCEDEKLLGGTLFALDGCKLPTNASKEWSGKISALHKKKETIETRLKQLMEEQIEEDKKDLIKKKVGFGVDRDGQIERLKKKADRIGKWLEENEPKIGFQGREIQSNITDNESATMPTSKGTIQGYNAQALLDAKHQIIVHGEAFGNGQDHGHVPPMIDAAKENVTSIGKDEDYFRDQVFTADTSYHSGDNLKKCEKEGLDAYIPDRDFRRRDPRFASRGRNRPVTPRDFIDDDFVYDESADRFTCPNGKALKFTVRKIWFGKDVFRYAAERKDCDSCELRKRCIKKATVRRKFLNIPVSGREINYARKMADKVDTEKGKTIYPLRQGIVEPVFANIRVQKRLNRFTLRGKVKVNIQWILYCIIHNIEKITNYGCRFAYE